MTSIYNDVPFLMGLWMTRSIVKDTGLSFAAARAIAAALTLTLGSDNEEDWDRFVKAVQDNGAKLATWVEDDSSGPSPVVSIEGPNGVWCEDHEGMPGRAGEGYDEKRQERSR